MESTVDPFEYAGGVVEPGESEKLRFTISETYLGDPVRIPVTIVNGAEPGPTCFLSAAIHGDELNGIEVVREVVDEWNHDDIHGCLVGLPVLNVPGFIAQERYLPIYERDLNRAFPGNADSTSAYRIAHSIYTNFIEPCDFGIDFHTSTRGRTNMFHVRADMENDAVERLARAFGSHLIIASEGSEGTLRREATVGGVPTITIEMGQAHRFERPLIEEALEGVRSVFAEYELYPQESVRWPGWRTTIEGWGERTWLRADTGGIVDMHHTQGDLVHADEVICTITSPFKSDVETVRAPFTGLLVGVLENPVGHTTHGYKPLPSDAYVAHEDSYYQTKHVVTGRTQIERQLVRVDPVPKEHVPEDAVLIDTLEQPSARTLKILHSYTQTDGQTSSAELLRGDAYVLRRPAELKSRLATGDLDDRVVTMTESGTWAYRVRTTSEQIVETAYTTLAVEVANSRPAFREVVFGSRIDAELTPATLPTDAQEILDQAIARETYTETAPLSESFDTMLEALGLGAVDTAANGKLLWYDEKFYRYALYVNPPAS